MKISTSYHGDIEIDNQQTLTFNQGIPGFLEETEFLGEQIFCEIF